MKLLTWSELVDKHRLTAGPDWKDVEKMIDEMPLGGVYKAKRFDFVKKLIEKGYPTPSVCRITTHELKLSWSLPHSSTVSMELVWSGELTLRVKTPSDNQLTCGPLELEE